MLRILLICFLLVTPGCTKRVVEVVVKKPVVPPHLLVSCDELNRLSAGNGATLLPWMIDASSKYKDCKAKHEALVEIVK